MTAIELIKAGDLSTSLEQLKEDIKKDPSDPKLRNFMFQLLSVMGDWERAMTQLNVVADMDKTCAMMAHVCRPLLNCEVLRQEIFNGERSPIIFGEPEEWVGWMVQANQFFAKEKYEEANELRKKALEAAPAVPGTINGNDFAWIADADSRLGPILEIIIDGRYYWTSFSNIKSVELEAPDDLRDLVWFPAKFTWRNEGESMGFIPTRYSGSEKENESKLSLARETRWVGKTSDTYIGLGQRMLTSDQDDYPLLEIKEIKF